MFGRRIIGVGGAAALAAATALVAGAHTAAPQTETTSGSQTFEYTGVEQSFTVPAGVTQITVQASGAQGGDGGTPDDLVPLGGSDEPQGGLGGPGSTATATLAVTPGEQLRVIAGGAGVPADFQDGGAGGFGGSAGETAGGDGASVTVANHAGGAGGGGGGSAVLRGSTFLVVGSGGGGGGGSGDSDEDPPFQAGGNGGGGDADGSDGEVEFCSAFGGQSGNNGGQGGAGGVFEMEPPCGEDGAAGNAGENGAATGAGGDGGPGGIDDDDGPPAPDSETYPLSIGGGGNQGGGGGGGGGGATGGGGGGGGGSNEEFTAGAGGGGGGGSSLVPAGGTLVAGDRLGDGVVVISWGVAPVRVAPTFTG